MPSYRVRPGVRFGAAKQHGPGDVVELSEREAKGFLDKLELVREPDPPTSLPAPPSDEKPKADEQDEAQAAEEVGADKGDEGKDEKPKVKGKK